VNELLSRVRRLEQKAEEKTGKRVVVLFKPAELTEEEVLADRSEIDPEDPSLNIVFVSWFSDSEPGSK
jgi:hypothetical protein